MLHAQSSCRGGQWVTSCKREPASNIDLRENSVWMRSCRALCTKDGSKMRTRMSMKSSPPTVWIVIALVSATPTSGCGGRSATLRATAEALSKSADQCLLDVRDRRLTYEMSRNCSALGALAGTYVEAGGFQPGVAADIAIVAEQARATAWMARATSLAGGRFLSLW
jgi:hypothetical protein